MSEEAGREALLGHMPKKRCASLSSNAECLNIWRIHVTEKLLLHNNHTTSDQHCMLCHNLISLQIFTLLIKISVRGTLRGFSVAYDECRGKNKGRQRQNITVEK